MKTNKKAVVVIFVACLIVFFLVLLLININNQNIIDDSSVAAPGSIVVDLSVDYGEKLGGASGFLGGMKTGKGDTKLFLDLKPKYLRKGVLKIESPNPPIPLAYDYDELLMFH